MSFNAFLAIEYPTVAGLALAGTLDFRFYAAAVLVEAGFCIFRCVKYRRWFRRTPFDWAVALLLLTLPVTLWASSQPEITLPQVLRLLAGAALFYALVNWARDIRRLRLAVDSALVLGIVLAVLAPVIVRWNAFKLPLIPPWLYSSFRLLVADSVNPNVIAGALVLTMLLGAGVLSFASPSQVGWSSLERWLALASVFLSLLVILLTQSRGAWLAAAAGFGIILVLRWRWGWTVLLGIVAVVFLVAILLGPVELAGLLVSSPSLGGMEGRLEVWNRAIYMLQDFPFTGIGMGTFTQVADRLYPFFLFAPGTIEHAHNLYLQVAVDLGLPGLIAWLAIFLVGLYCGWRSFSHARLNGEAWLAGLGVGVLAAQAALGVHGLLDAVAWGMVRTAPLIWLVWGLSAAAFLSCNHNKGRPDELEAVA